LPLNLITVIDYIMKFWQSFQPVFYILIGLAVFLIVVGCINRAVKKLRERGALTRSAEGKFKLIVIFAGLAIYVTYVFTIIKAETFWILAIVVAAVTGLILYSVRSLFENLFTFLIISSSNIIREGERIILKFGDEEIEGYVTELNEYYVVIRTHHNAFVYVPNSRIAQAIIVRPSQTTLKLKLSISVDGSTNVDQLIKFLEDVVLRSKLINKSTVQIRPVEIYENRIVVVIEADVLNPRNVDQAYAEIVDLVRTMLPHRVRIEVPE